MQNRHKILILGGGQAQLGLIKAAKKMGLYVIVVGKFGNYPGYEFADRVYYIDIKDKESIAEMAENEGIAGVTMCCSDFGLETLGYVCDKLHLKGITEEIAALSSDKLKMKQALTRLGISTARYMKVQNIEDLSNVTDTLCFPLIVKAVDLQGSKGIYLSTNEDSLKSNILKTLELSNKKYCIVEEYIVGEEIGAQALVVDGKPIIIQMHGDIVLRHGDVNIPIGHFMPYKTGNSDLDNRIYDLITNAIKGLKFNDCAVNIDIIIRNNIPYIIELTGRAGANQLPELMSKILGVNYYNLILLTSIGENIKSYNEQHCILKNNFAFARQLYSTRNGRVDWIRCKHIIRNVDYTMFVQPGDYVHKFTNSAECIGKIICWGQDKQQCVKAMNLMLKDCLSISVDGNTLELS